MKKVFNISLIISALLVMVSCQDNAKPNYQYMPNMYEPVGYEAYGEYDVFPGGQEAMIPAKGSIKRGYVPYEYANSNEGYALAKAELLNPMAADTLAIEDNLKTGKELYNIYCAVCHGTKGDGQGILMKREKILGVPSYAAREITEGSIYHVMEHGINSMGSYASQLNQTERWQVTMHVQALRAELTK
ncbi:c-type cytochrome [Spongiivirga citrea]|uniref:Cytochrome c n=1 Tax=Spongiivirga citrea TaxID=1481457 RepID=A0A6M0CQF4_9FLAO|nr:cytochrome c [Spongiivirga citrea]NER18109.1 cytochrome c [Spongiivirga citrea]